MDYCIVENLLNDDELSELDYMVKSPHAEWNKPHESIQNLNDEPATEDDTKGYKENIFSMDHYDEIKEIIYAATDRCFEWVNFTQPIESGVPMITKTLEGGFYKPHHDASKCGHFSTTIFLNDPDEYDGGELQLDFNGDIKNVKLPAGSSITYRTGTPHCVNLVTRGQRNVAVFWTKTQYPDPHEWMIMKGIKKALDLLPCKTYANLEEAREDPYFVLATLMHNIERKNLS